MDANDEGGQMNPTSLRDFRLVAMLCCTLLLSLFSAVESPGKTRLVIAHPDDEYYIATVYRMATQLHRKWMSSSSLMAKAASGIPLSRNPITRRWSET
jgi:hypothetical protein